MNSIRYLSRSPFLFKVFTLIELLFVIGIIAILAAILLPALNSAREKTKSINCMNNLKQWNLCCVNYINDSSEFFPPYQFPSGGTYYYPLFEGDTAIMRDYLPMKAGWIYGKADTSFYIANKAKASSLSCPAAVIPKRFGMDYGENCFLGAASGRQAAGRFNAATINRVFFKVYRIQNPSRVMFWGDAYNYSLRNPAPSFEDEASGLPAGTMRYPHRNSANLLYVDGHAGSYRYSLPNTPAETATQCEPWL